MALTTNTALYNFQSDRTRITVLGQDTVTNLISFYTVEIPVHDPVTGYPKDRLFGRKKDRSNVFGRDGELADITLQNVTINEYTGTIALADNEVFEIDKNVIEGYRNVLEAVALGESFYATNGGNLIKILGIGGNVKLAGGTMLRGKDWKYFFSRDAKCIRAYTGELTTNPFLGAYNKTSISNMLELKCSSNADSDQVLKYTAVCFGNASGDEAEEKNMTNMDLDFISDFRIYNNFLVEGFATGDADVDSGAGAGTLYRVNVDYIIAQSGGADPTDFGTAGEIACIIDTDDGTFTLKSTNGTDAWTALTDTVASECIIWSPKVGTGATVAAATENYALVAVKTGGDDGSGTAVGTTVTSQTTYTTGTTYHADVYNFDFATGEFIKVAVASEL